ncbi:MAG TPA: phosphoglucosamine mutase [Fimbriiglobus sp.]
MSELIVSVSGIRGIVGDSLTPEAALRFGQALGTEFGGGTVLVSRDGRPSGRMLAHAAAAGLMATGCSIHYLDVAPTPTVGIAVREMKAAGAIQITASHNPAPWNGLKLFGPDGAVLPAANGKRVAERFTTGKFTQAKWDGVGSDSYGSNALDLHVSKVLEHEPMKHRFKVFVDGNGGAGGPLALRLLQAIGCEVVAHHCESDGQFAHEAEPIPAHLTGVAPLVKQAGAAIGFVLDPDADRLALIDETGTCVSEELTLALAVKYRLRKVKGPVVVNMSTSRVNEDLAKEAGCACYRSAVGEANVVEKMRATNAVIGGEGNGGVIDPRIGWVRDPFIGMALILSLMAEDCLPLSKLVAGLPKYEMLKTKYAVAKEALPAALTRIEARWPGAAVNKEDGLRLDGPDWWLHVRPSNTEPVVRVIAEAPTRARCETLCAAAASLLQ